MTREWSWWRAALSWVGIGNRTLSVRSYKSLMGALDELNERMRKDK